MFVGLTKRVVTVPNTINGKTGLVCRFIGTPKDLELLTIDEVLEMSKAFPVHSYPEALESSSMSSNGSMKSCAKNMAEAAWRARMPHNKTPRIE